jgi:F0F1-type ATP synthase assembly protein I
MKKYLKKPQKQPSNNSTEYLKYTGLAFQLIGGILLMALIGHGIDNKLQNTKPIYTLVFSVVAVIVLLYKLIHNFTK